MKDVVDVYNTNLLKCIPEEARNHCSWRLTDFLNINQRSFWKRLGGREEDAVFKHHQWICYKI